jgi:hypothetical protein
MTCCPSLIQGPASVHRKFDFVDKQNVFGCFVVIEN